MHRIRGAHDFRDVSSIRMATESRKQSCSSTIRPRRSRPASKPPTRDHGSDQQDLRARVLPIVVGTEVRFPNRDQISHHVYSFSRTKSFELPLYKGEDAPPVLFDKPGVVKIGCNIHDWMSAIILVLPNTHFATTDDDGRFHDCPACSLAPTTLLAWHRAESRKDRGYRPARAAGGERLELTFHLSLADERSRPAMRGSRWDQ